jgi:RNA polymerase sigma factor (sigma-70 family)
MSRSSDPQDLAIAVEVDKDSLFAKAQAGDEVAWRLLFEECYPKIQRFVRFRIKGRMRRYLDSTDIANDVFGELALKAAGFRFETVEQVKGFLIDAAHKRVVDEYRRQQTKKRGAGRELPLSDGPGEDAWGISSGEPTPSQHAVAHETDERLRAVPADAEERRVLDLRRENYENDEISTITGWSIRRVQRFLVKLRPTFLN